MCVCVCVWREQKRVRIRGKKVGESCGGNEREETALLVFAQHVRRRDKRHHSSDSLIYCERQPGIFNKPTPSTHTRAHTPTHTHTHTHTHTYTHTHSQPQTQPQLLCC